MGVEKTHSTDANGKRCAAASQAHQVEITAASMNAPETAPQDGNVILADFGYPWIFAATWNAHDDKWCAATLSAQEMENGKTDTWFENEYYKHSEMIGWLPMPFSERHSSPQSSLPSPE